MTDRNRYPGRQWEDRFSLCAEELPGHYMKMEQELRVTGFVTRERLSLEQAQARRGQASEIMPGTVWGNYWEYGWFFTEWSVPAGLADRHLIFLPGVGEEMLVWVNGKEQGAVDQRHRYVTLDTHACAGAQFLIVMECYAGHGPRLEGGGFCQEGHMPFQEEDVPQLTAGISGVAVWQEEIFQTAMDYLTLDALRTRLPERSLRRQKITQGLKRFVTQVDLELPDERLAASVQQAGEVLKPLLACTNGSTAPDFVIFGQSHLDLAWLWTTEETRRKAARTYSTQLALLEQYPAYRFLLCEPPILEYLKESYPALWERVREKVKSGQIIPEGAVYVESDMNMPCGESLVRQLMYGKEWYRKEFGVDSRVAWLPDTFGFSGALPQLLKQCGIPYFATQKLVRQDPECEPFPYNDFWWQGIDGSRVLAHLYKENNAKFSPADMIMRWEEDRIQDEGMEGMLYPFGYGDGGGGPTRELLETAERCADLEGAPRAHYGSPADYFDALARRGTDNVFSGELYLSWHRGTYTAQARTKKGVRRAECLLKEAEYWNTVLAMHQTGTQEYPGMGAAASLRALWKRLLFQEFHDILPGTGIAKVHAEAVAELEAVAAESETILRDALRALQALSPDSAAPAKAPEDTAAHRTGYSGETGRAYLESSCLYAELDQTGGIRVLSHGRGMYNYADEALPMNTLRLYRNINGYYDAWEIGSMYELEEETIDRSGWRLVQASFRGQPAWKLEGSVNLSPFEQIICMSGDGSMLEFHMRIDWMERHKMLKTDFASTVHSHSASGETAFGLCRRPTTGSYQWEKDRYEVCCHRFCVLENGREGFALVNDCKYGYSTKEDRISLTLLRAPLLPDMYADQGMQEFSYACCPFKGRLCDAGVIQRAAAFNRASHVTGFLRAQAGPLYRKYSLYDIQAVGGDGSCHVLTESVKLSEDGSRQAVLRLYEAAGIPQRVRLSLPAGLQHVEESDLLESRRATITLKDGHADLEFGAFEIRTFLISAETV